MNIEDFLRLSIEEILNVEKSEIDKHFKIFKKKYQKFSGIPESLNAKVLTVEGKEADSIEIENQIVQLKKSFQNGMPELFELIVKNFYSWLELFINEIDLQTDYAITSFNKYLEIKNSNHVEVKEIFREIHHFAIHVANIGKLTEKLTEPENSIKTHLLSQIINTTSFDLKNIKDLRNHLEHYEERLEAWHYLYCGNPILDMNIIGSNTKGVDFEKCLRVLNIDEDIYYLLGERFDLKNLQGKVNTINKSLKNVILANKTLNTDSGNGPAEG